MSDSLVAHQFDDADQQHTAASLGMWTFLITEVMFFGGLFTAYAVYRVLHPAAFAAGSRHLYMWIGAANTAVLLISSLTMALAVAACGLGDRKLTRRFLLITALLGLTFLGLKSVEYYLDYREGLVPGANFRTDWTVDPGSTAMFFILYFIMTAIHALHMTIGVVVVGVVSVGVSRSEHPAERSNAVEMVGLYWHFVDIVWIFLFPLLYLIRL